ncbi:hypothetical protein KTH93_11660 [Acinetobacter bereziniae]|uniref:hypothetical protein n=1 Tax=Acinetobacter bereziniae TaxID=106648 RepID=UPI0021CFF592|nr:hypothetical protein [Acinetobacter bereziniae]MCU4436125.1 hypothetical protein [Acinetobacter bereziniae]
MNNSLFSRKQVQRRGTSVRHGLISGYQHYKCRCEACKEAKRVYELKRKQNRGELPSEFVGPKQIQHGTFTAYSYHKCRCEVCAAFMRGYQSRTNTLSDNTDFIPDDDLNEKQHAHGTAESYSFGCNCDLCLKVGRKEWLKTQGVLVA